MWGVIPATFYSGTGVVARLNETDNLQIEAPIAMADAQTIYKTLVMATDYKVDSRFFYRNLNVVDHAISTHFTFATNQFPIILQ